MPLLRAAKQHDHLKKKSRLEEDKLIIKGKPYTTSNLHELPEEINVFSATTREDEASIAFFGALNPLSNFYDAEFVVDGITYISSEQYIQAMKALHFKDKTAYNLVMGSRTSLDCKIHGSKVKNYRKEDWDSKAKDICRPGIHAKFQQNPELHLLLCEKTTTKTIVESARDSVWGTGMTLGNPDCLDRDKWVCQGILGELLEEVRSKQYQQPQPLVSASSTATPIVANAAEPIATKMLSIANYPPPVPTLQPPPLPETTLYMPNMTNVTWPPGLVPTPNGYQMPFQAYPQPGYPGFQMQPAPRPIVANSTSSQPSLSQPEPTTTNVQSATSHSEETTMESS